MSNALRVFLTKPGGKLYHRRGGKARAEGSYMSADKLAAVVQYVVGKHSEEWLGRIELVKLVFLVDHQAFQELGHTITDVQYEQQTQGPLSWPIVDVVSILRSVEENAFTTKQGHRSYDYKPTKQFPGDPLGALSAPEREVVEKVIDEWGGEWWEMILDHVHGLPFVELFSCGELYDWTKFVREEDMIMTKADHERARARLAELRERAAVVKAEDDGSPYEWTDEGEAEATKTLSVTRGSQARTIP